MTPRFTRNRSLRSLPQIAQDPSQFMTLFSAEDYRIRLLQLISQARSRIYIVALYLEDDLAGRSVMDALYQAKQQRPELQIKVLVDWHRAQRGLIGEQQAQGNAAMYREYAAKYPGLIEISGVPVSNRELFGVLHLKGSIIDDTIIYSGASINDIYLAQQQRYRFDRYQLIGNSDLANAMVEYLEQVLLATRAVTSLSVANPASTRSLKSSIRRLRLSLQRQQYQFHAQQLNAQQLGITPLIGLGRRRNLLNKTIKLLMSKAKQQLTICTPYFNPPRSLRREVAKALSRGVRVHLIVGDKTASDFYSEPSEKFKVIHALPYLYEVTLRNFIKGKQAFLASGQLTVNVWQHANNSFHLKGLWVDQRYALLTGNNLNPRAWNLDLENGLLVDDPHALLEHQRQQELHNILQHTQPITTLADIESLNDYPKPVKRLLKRIGRVKADSLLKQIL
ncbi:MULTISPECIES: CDP-diacylglycerol--serine O-phosphatidyltransferase [unclassified Agarivorans]|uniref:CDP-diacylglycerol--serine O-phosphatidyltransferase n=1 Tax=unclassified Agarivorans TaxID=2636026 RepID=UPI003D7CCEFF